MLSANLLLNGSFEGGPVVFNLFTTVGSNQIPGWSITAGNMDYIRNAWEASDGEFSLDMDGFSPGTIGQTFGTTVGRVYDVSFDMAGNPDPAPPIKSLRVQAAGQSADFSFDTTGKTGADMGWVTKTFSFTATAATTTLEFKSLMPADSSRGPALDNVIVTNRPVAASTIIVDLDDHSKELVISDQGAGDDTLVIKSHVAKKRFVIHDPNNNVVSTIAGAIQQDSHTVYVPFNLVKGSRILVLGSFGDDQLTVDFGLGKFSKDIAYLGGEGHNQLHLVGGSFAVEKWLTTGTGGGIIQLDKTAIELNDVSFMSDLTRVARFIPKAGVDDNRIDLVDGPTIGGQATNLLVGPGLFTPTHLANKGEVHVDMLSGHDTVHINIPHAAPRLAKFHIELGEGFDTVGRGDANPIPMFVVGVPTTIS